MALAIVAPNKTDNELNSWRNIFQELAPEIDLQVYPEIKDKALVEVVVLWQHPKNILKTFPNLKLICSMGSGVDHIMADYIPKGVPITRIVDPRLTFSMTNYVVMGILNFHRQINRYIVNKRLKKWDMTQPEIPISVGVMGVGELGGDVLDKVHGLGIPCFGYGNSPKTSFRHPYYYGPQLQEFLDKINVVVCLLPLTPKTEGFLNDDLFNKFKPGTYLINVARGKHLVEEDLIPAIESGQVSGALLDVFSKEPLPETHPFWSKDEIMVTPHIASITNYRAAAPQIIANYKNAMENRPLINEVSTVQGY
ncbi:2-hydroxyacid dehydrogenase [Cyclobacterium marinum]|uniref:D-isomer specific 2-hydroxyacid dehydrogenase NAD-binding protein n=1 Tax=Cyclobacterium marinum (strain ATCC 25205 / DSM 745 / LMG 13164 / NCIMB 1802) TaxID=880070 RepID=G0IWH8_CYCMS|nr:glyoxylate/hydroxypyruvate reductase A [Cyclobacterium marinum]AEL27972.1 D-isomer specific 2-hydroxyacid dehydrogenase NAD-binding protein [Cyclobacterium marinum DSM 745]